MTVLAGSALNVSSASDPQPQPDESLVIGPRRLQTAGKKVGEQMGGDPVVIIGQFMLWLLRL